MSKPSPLLILLVDADDIRMSTLNAKMRPLGYQVSHCHSIEESLKFQKANPAQLIIIEQSLLDNFVGNYRKKIKEIGSPHVSVFMISTHAVSNSKDYFSKGVDGIFEQLVDARTMMMAVRKSMLPLDLQWQMTQSLRPAERLSFIANSLDDLHKHTRLSFGSGGFCTQFSQEMNLGDRVEFTFYFKDQDKAYVIQGISVIRWFDPNTLWGGLEFESVSGQGVQVFIQWLQQQDFYEFVPTAA